MDRKRECETPSAQLTALADEAWEQLPGRFDRPVESLARGTEEEAEAVSTAAMAMAAHLNSIPLATLTASERITHGYLGWHCEREAGTARRWRENFAVTPYMAMALAEAPNAVMVTFDFASSADGERYLSLLADYASFLAATTARLKAQARRGWRIPRPALPGARASMFSLKARVMAALRPLSERLVTVGDGAAALARKIDQMLATEVEPAFDAILASLDGDYASKSNDAVGLMHLPGGAAAYRAQNRYYLTLEMEPETLHAHGLEAIAEITESMAAIREKLSPGDDEAQFHTRLRASPGSYATDADALEASYRQKLAQVARQLPDYFPVMPKAGYAIRRLEPELEAHMSFGYYQPGARPGDDGVYYFNGSKLHERLQFTAAPLIFHELPPGAHLQATLQRENEALPALRRNAADTTIFTYAWAGYAAGLVGEMGLYDEPLDAYGYLLFERFGALRLVLDTGMNALGWTLEKARSYLRANSLEGEDFVASETLRYSTDLPGQALNYRVGPDKLREMRRSSKARLGEAFDLRLWHAAVLAEGVLPLPLLETHLQCWEDNLVSPAGRKP